MKKIFSKPWLFILFITIACNNSEKKDKELVTKESVPVSSEKIPLLHQNGQSLDLSQYKGKYVFVNLWATWCKPCVFEMPSLQRLTEKLKGENIVFLFASEESEQEIAEFKRSNNYQMEFAKIPSLADLNISAIPTTFIYDKNGAVAFTETGAREWDSDESIAMINKIIKQ